MRAREEPYMVPGLHTEGPSARTGRDRGREAGWEAGKEKRKREGGGTMRRKKILVRFHLFVLKHGRKLNNIMSFSTSLCCFLQMFKAAISLQQTRNKRELNILL
jgi:hypothetical protein